MAERLYPEAIRGSWFLLEQEQSAEEVAASGKLDVISFRFDQRFVRHQSKSGSLREKESGDYTFDGEFLITRSRNTETYRVRPDGWWRWDIETKKDAFVLRRALTTPLAGAISGEDARAIRILPIRVKARPILEGDTGLHELTYDRGGELEEPVVVGLASVELDRERGAAWIGLTPLVEGIAPKTWARVAHESLFDLHLGDVSEVTSLEVLSLDSGEVTAFELG